MQINRIAIVVFTDICLSVVACATRLDDPSRKLQGRNSLAESEIAGGPCVFPSHDRHPSGANQSMSQTAGYPSSTVASRKDVGSFFGPSGDHEGEDFRGLDSGV